MTVSDSSIHDLLQEHGQGHVCRFWEDLDLEARRHLTEQVNRIDFRLMSRLVRDWIENEPSEASFDTITPVATLPVVDPNTSDSRQAWEAGEEALRSGRVGLVLVAGGQGTRLGYDGPKGAYPIGPITGKSLFAYHAEKILNLQTRYGCRLPWYIMVSDTNEEATRAFFRDSRYFGLEAADIHFFKQRMVPCIDPQGRFMLDSPSNIAMNPNGHGGSIPALVENGILDDARERGIDVLSYFQVDNWAVKVADPAFIGYHVMGHGDMSSKVHRKRDVRESVGVHCLCDGQYQVIEYTELDLYPQLLETDQSGAVRYYAGNPAIHILSVDFVQRVFENYDAFPWHRAHKKIPYIDEGGNRMEPDAPNGYKFETFVFDALRFIDHAPIALEIHAPGEYTPIKQLEGPNSVAMARRTQRTYWAAWLERAGYTVPRTPEGDIAVDIEISPQFAQYQEEFLANAGGKSWSLEQGLAIGPAGRAINRSR